MALADVETLFKRGGGEFLASPKEMARKVRTIRAFVFDWDGVFNLGFKGNGNASLYSEADSMGLNLLRFAFWLDRNVIPYTAIITGEKNPAALEMAEREHFHAVFAKRKDKKKVIDSILLHQKLKLPEIACCFDDVGDLAMAQSCGMRFLVRSDANPLFLKYVRKKNLADYVTGRTGERHAVREICELILGLRGEFERVVTSRMEWSPDYGEYLRSRNALELDRD